MRTFAKPSQTTAEVLDVTSPLNANDAANKSYVDNNFINITNSGNDVDDPSNPQDVATKNYTDTVNTIWVTLQTGSNTTLDPADLQTYVRANSTGGAFAITLPATSVGIGRHIIIKDANATAATNNITILPAGSDTISGLSSYVINQQSGSVELASDGGFNWDVVGTVNPSNYIRFDGAVDFTNNQSMGSHKLVNVLDPTSAQDAMTLAYSQTNGGTWAFSDGYTTTNSSAGTIRTLALTDNAITYIDFIYEARDTGNNWYTKRSSTSWTRSAGGNATQIGIENGPAAVDNITVTGATITGSTTNVLIKFGGHVSTHTSGKLYTWVFTVAQAAAT